MEQVHKISKDSDDASIQREILRSRVDDLSADDLVTYVEQLEERWGINNRGDQWFPLICGFRQLYTPEKLGQDGLPLEPTDPHVAERFKLLQQTLGQLYHRSNELGISFDEAEDIAGTELTVRSRVCRLLGMVREAYNTVSGYANIFDRINNPTRVPEDPDADYTFMRGGTLEDLKDPSAYQQLILAMLSKLDEKKYRRYKEQCCAEIKTEKMYSTRAWKPVMSINDFVYDTAQKETDSDIWKNLTQKASNAKDVTKHLTQCRDIQFPEIVKNRNVWSFKNGLFVGKEWCEKTQNYSCRFYPYESSEIRRLDPTIISSKYFDKTFETYEDVEDWYDIPTPHFQSILDYQRFEPDVCKWIYVMGGRLCFDVNDMDGWQIIPFFKGVARSGKSTLITKVFKRFYDSEDVRTLSNNIERKFGLSSIYDGLMFIAPEIKGDMCLEQAEFQSLVSGEDVSIARKNEKAKCIEWKIPGILGGNEIPNWKDNSGSVLRRVLTWNFSKQVMEADPHLDVKLDHELPAIMLKCIRAYLEYAQRYSDQDIWNVVPKYFKTIQTQLAMATSSLQHFLASEKVIYGEDKFCPQKIFVQIFNDHCQENNLGKFKFSPDFYMGPFSAKQIEVHTESCTYKGRVYPPQPIIRGLDVVQDTLQFSDDY